MKKELIEKYVALIRKSGDKRWILKKYLENMTEIELTEKIALLENN